MKCFLLISVSLASLIFSGCDKSIAQVQAPADTDARSPFAVFAPVYSVSRIDGRYRIDSSVVWEGKNRSRMIEQLERQNLSEKKSINEMPAFMRSFFDGLYPGKKMEIADPGQEWKDGSPEIQLFDKTGKPLNNILPTRQLVYFGLGKNMALLSYYIGDREKSQEMVIVSFSGEKITDLYFDRNPARVTSRSEIVDYMKKHQNQGGC